MIGTNNVSLQFGGRTLFSGADLQFTRGNCYGIIGANGAGKSTFLKILSGELEPTKGEVFKTPTERLSVLKQDHYAYNDCTALRTVLLGNPELVRIGDERDEIYSKEEMTEEDGVRAGELEEKYAELGGYTCESDAEMLLNDLGIMLLDLLDEDIVAFREMDHIVGHIRSSGRYVGCIGNLRSRIVFGIYLHKVYFLIFI